MKLKEVLQALPALWGTNFMLSFAKSGEMCLVGLTHPRILMHLHYVGGS